MRRFRGLYCGYTGGARAFRAGHYDHHHLSAPRSIPQIHRASSGDDLLHAHGTWMLTSISPREWVAVHRKHHNFTDVEGDPHSPHIEGYWRIMLANVYYYRREANNDGTLQKYASDLPHDRLDRVLLERGALGFALTGVILVLHIGFGPGLVALATLAVVYLVLNA